MLKKNRARRIVLSGMVLVSLTGCASLGIGGPHASRQTPQAAQAKAEMAAHWGRAAELARLLDSGVDVNVLRGETGLLDNAIAGCASGKVAPAQTLSVVSLLAERGVDINRADSRNNTVLIYAAQRCDASVVERLIQLGAKVDYLNKQNFSPLAMALVLGKTDVARVLVDNGATLSASQLKTLYVELPTDPVVLSLLDRAQAAFQEKRQ